MDPTTLRAVTRRFPLLGEARPACPSLTARVAEITAIAATAAAAAAPSSDTAMHHSAHALNKAALLASDCGLPEDARALCRRHIDVYRAAATTGPLTTRQARYLCEPVHNLARLDLRADHSEAARQRLHAMHTAAVNGTDLLIDGTPVPVAYIGGDPHDRQQLAEWAWRQCLADSIRAFTLDHRWDDAAGFASDHRGVGLHLMDGRQTIIVARVLAGDLPGARDQLTGSLITQPWEHEISACLSVLCADPDDATASITSMIGRYHQHQHHRTHILYHTRLALIVTTLAASTRPAEAIEILTQIAEAVLDTGDGYAARDLLRYRNDMVVVPEPQRARLAAVVTDCGLGSGMLPGQLHTQVTKAVDTAAHALTQSLLAPDKLETSTGAPFHGVLRRPSP